MSGDQVAAAAVGAGLMLLVMGALMTIALAFIYQGAHAARLDVQERDSDRARRYHRLSPDERRIWRATASGQHPVTPDGSWQVGRA